MHERPIFLLIGTGLCALLLLLGCATSGVLEKGGWVFEGDDVIVVQTEGSGEQESTGTQKKTIRHVAQVLKRSEIAVDTVDQGAGYLRTTAIPINDTLAARLNVVATDTSTVEIAGEFSDLSDEGGEWRRYAWNESLPRSTEVWSLMKDLATAIGSIEEYKYSQNRLGGGLQLAGSTAAKDVGPGVHVRTSIPINREFSLGVGGTFTGFLFSGSEQGAYAMDMDASIIVTWPNPTPSSLYMLAGAGYHLPMGNRYGDASSTTGDLEVESGPTFHLGLGYVWQLEAISLYVELAPTLFFRRERSDVVAPLRGGIIF